MNKYRDKREAGAYAYAVDPANNFDYINIARVIDAQGPSRTEKGVQQMIAEGHHALKKPTLLNRTLLLPLRAKWREDKDILGRFR